MADLTEIASKILDAMDGPSMDAMTPQPPSRPRGPQPLGGNDPAPHEGPITEEYQRRKLSQSLQRWADDFDETRGDHLDAFMDDLERAAAALGLHDAEFAIYPTAPDINPYF